MATVDVVFPINGKDDVFDQQDFAVMDALDQMFPVSRAVSRRTVLDHAQTALKRAQGLHQVWLGRRPLLLDHCFHIQGQYDQMVVVLPTGSTWDAVNKAYSWLHNKDNSWNTDTDSEMRHFAREEIIPLLDTRGWFSRYPWDVRIAFDLMYTMRLALGKGRIGRGETVMIDSIVMDVPTPRPPTPEEGTEVHRETRQFALVLNFKRLPM